MNLEAQRKKKEAEKHRQSLEDADRAAGEIVARAREEAEEIRRNADEMISYYESLIREFPILSIEDGLFEDDWDGWQKLTKRMFFSTTSSS